MNRLLQRVLERTPQTHDSARLIRALVLLLLGLCVGIGAAAADIYLHRGIESGAESPHVVQTTGGELAVNVDLLSFAPEQLTEVAIVLQTNGYRYVRQSFSWADIEPSKGTLDWSRYDAVVESLVARDMRVIAVVHDTPAWARSAEAAAYPDAPPTDVNLYAGFVGALAQRYGESIQFIQLWDRPNSAEQWGGRPAEPLQYLALLAPAFNAARTANPEAKIILAELDPGGDAMIGADLGFLGDLYVAGAAPFFDIVAARIDGGTSSPYDRQVDAARANFSRAILFRELMLDHGDREKPIWLTHFGWDGTTASVDRQQQADFTLAAIKRARAEWPWLGLMVGWSLLPRAADDAEAGRSLLDAAGAATPVFTALSDFADSGGTSIGTTGFVPMDSAAVSYEGNWSDQHLDRVEFRTTSEFGSSVTLRFRGTGLTTIIRFGPRLGEIRGTLDGEPIPGWPQEDGASLISLENFVAVDFPLLLVSDVRDGVHELTLQLTEGGEQLTVGGMIVSRDPPLLWPVIVLILVGVVLVIGGLRDVAYVVAHRTKLLQRETGMSLRPPLPRLPDWTPARRF